MNDITLSARLLRRNPGFTAVAAITLAVGIGANAAVFSVIKAVLLDALPYAEAGRLVTIAETAADASENPTVDYTSVPEVRERSRSFERVSAYRDGPGILLENGVPEMLRGLSVDYDFFDTLGVKMELGRGFVREEQQRGKRTALVLSHGLWVRRFGADPNILGRVLRLSGYQVTVVGVLPPGFKPLLKATSELPAEMYYPLAIDPFFSCRKCSPVRVVGRLKAGTTLGAARAETNALLERIVRETPEAHLPGARLALVPLPDMLLGRARAALWAVWGAVAFVLLIACANVAHLLLARATGRTKEMAVRTALGASRARLVRQLLTESGLLACAGGALGTLLAIGGTRALASLAPAEIPRAQSAHINLTVVAFALAATVLSAVLFGAAPAWRASRADLNQAIKGTDAAGGTHRRLRGALAASGIALAFVLAAGAGLMARTFWRLMSVNAGYEHRGVLTLTTCVIGPRYSGKTIAYYREVIERLRAIPGVEGAAMTSLIPMDYTDRVPMYREDRPMMSETDAPSVDLFSVSSDYFRVMRIPVKRGRVFTEQDTESTPRVALISESCARAQFPGEDPIGRHVRLGGNDHWMRVVGVVGDVRQDGLDHAADMQVYTALNQEAINNFYRMLARTSGDPMRLERAVRNVFAEVDPGSPVYHVKALDGYFSRRLADRTFALALLVLLGGMALALAAVGIYGVMSYSVAQRTGEIGVRMALGAGRGPVVWMVLRESFGVVAAGLAVGFGASLALNRMIEGLLFEVQPNDAAAMGAAAAALAAAALLATYVPARRAASVHPMAALRCE